MRNGKFWRRWSGLASGRSEFVWQKRDFSARRVNALRKSPSVPVWQRNYYERIIRDEVELTEFATISRTTPRNRMTTRRTPLYRAFLSVVRSHFCQTNSTARLTNRPSPGWSGDAGRGRGVGGEGLHVASVRESALASAPNPPLYGPVGPGYATRWPHGCHDTSFRSGNPRRHRL